MYVSIFPVAFFLQAVYTESLFLMLSLACLYWSRESRWRLAGLAGLLATLSRSTGVLLLVPMAMIYYEQRDWELAAHGPPRGQPADDPEGLLVWMAYLGLSFHKPLLFAAVQDQWGAASTCRTTPSGAACSPPAAASCSSCRDRRRIATGRRRAAAA